MDMDFPPLPAFHRSTAATGLNQNSTMHVHLLQRQIRIDEVEENGLTDWPSPTQTTGWVE